MLWNVLAATLFVVATGAGAAQAQTLGQVGGPRELPPAGYASDQFVDSRGCVFVRAGVAGRTSWIPRLTRDRQVLCGYQPTFAAPAPVVAPRTPDPAGAPLTAVAPKAAATPRRVATARQPVRAAAAAPSPAAAASKTTVTQRTATRPAGPVVGIPLVRSASSCPGGLPVRTVYRLSNGESAVFCGPQDGYPAGAFLLLGKDGAAPAARTAAAVPAPPKGYRPAWKDGRLNPNRAKGTAAGQRAQDRVWTRDVPAQTVAKAAPAAPAARTAAAPAGTIRKTYVQVGSFGVPANAAGAAARLKAMGLPVATGRTTTGQTGLRIVFAGPFTNDQDANAALNKARRAGFADAFIRQ